MVEELLLLLGVSLDSVVHSSLEFSWEEIGHTRQPYTCCPSTFTDFCCPFIDMLLQEIITSLVTLQLLTLVGHDDQLDGPKYKCTVSLDFIRAIARTVNFDIIKYLYDFL